MDFGEKNILGREESSHEGAKLGKTGACFRCQGGRYVCGQMREGERGGHEGREGLALDSEGLAGRGKECGSHSEWEWKPPEGFEQNNMILFSVCKKPPSGCWGEKGLQEGRVGSRGNNWVTTVTHQMTGRGGRDQCGWKWKHLGSRHIYQWAAPTSSVKDGRWVL